MANEFDPFKKKIEAALKDIASSSNMQKLGDKAAEIIKKRTRLGFGVEKTGADKSKLKPLSDSYKLQRAGKIAFFTKKSKKGNFAIPINNPKNKPKLHSETSPSKSNLTYTGEMLDSLEATGENGKVTIKAAGTRENKLTNAKLVEYNEEMGRRFLDLAKADLKQLKDFLEALVDKLLK